MNSRHGTAPDAFNATPNNPPYPIGTPSGFPAMPQLPPQISRRLHNDNNRSSSAPERHHEPSSSHVLGYDRSRSRPRSRQTESTVSDNLPSSRFPVTNQQNINYSSEGPGYPTGPIRMPFPSNSSDFDLEPLSDYPSSNVYPPSIPSVGGYPPHPPSSTGYPPFPVPMPSNYYQQNNEDSRSRLDPSTLYPPPSVPSFNEDHQLHRSRTLPSNYRSRVVPSAPISLAEEEDFDLNGDQYGQAPPPSYDEVMREIRHQRASSMIIRR